MKIYNKKTFRAGIFNLFLTAGLLVTGILNGFQMKNVVLMALCFVIGISFFMRSLNKEMSRKDKVDDQDERNRLILLKSYSRAHMITQVGSVILMGIFWGIGMPRDLDLMIGAVLGVAFCLTVSLWGEFFARVYYEKKN